MQLPYDSRWEFPRDGLVLGKLLPGGLARLPFDLYTTLLYMPGEEQGPELVMSESEGIEIGFQKYFSVLKMSSLNH